MSAWVIETLDGTARLTETVFPTGELALDHLAKLPRVIQEMYRVAYRGGSERENRFLTEGLVKNDLEGILLPRLSVDEYVPNDPNTDNVVLGFYIKGVPEAVIPFTNFLDKCNGVLDTDYGDSDTIPNTSIIYVEMDRENLSLGDIKSILIQIGLLSNLEVADFTMTFPNTQDKFPFDLRVLKHYFDTRNAHKNLMAQRRAEDEANKKAEERVASLRQQDHQDKQAKQENPENE